MPSPAPKKKTATRAPARSNPPLPITMVRVDHIDPSPLNRDAAVDLAPLVDSIRTHGLQQPVKLRPTGDRFELVYGERRWRAFVKLGYPEIPATIEKLSDDEAQQRRILENTQRTDPHALEEAESYERLLAIHDAKGAPLHTPDSVAKLAGRSIGHIYNRLKLTSLHPTLRKALYKNELSLTAAFAIARGVPTDLQPEAWADLQKLAEDTFEDDLDDEGRLHARVVQDLITRNYLSRLSTAVFSLKDAKLVPAAGACQSCGKRSGNQPHLFAEADPADLCTDLSCFRQKTAAQIEREKQRVLAAGGTVLPEDKSRAIFNGGSHLPYNSKWLDLDGQCYEHPMHPTWRKLLGDLVPAPVLAFTSQGKPVLLADKAFVMETLKAHGLDPASIRSQDTTKASAKPHHDDPDDLQNDSHEPSAATAVDVPAQRGDYPLAALTRRRIMGAIIHAAETAGADDTRATQLVYESMLKGGYHNAITDTVKRRFMDDARPKSEHANDTLAGIAKTLTPDGLRALVLELAISRSAYFVNSDDTTYPPEVMRALAIFGIDPKPIEAAAEEEIRAKRAARPAKAKPGSA